MPVVRILLECFLVFCWDLIITCEPCLHNYLLQDVTPQCSTVIVQVKASLTDVVKFLKLLGLGQWKTILGGPDQKKTMKKTLVL